MKKIRLWAVVATIALFLTVFSAGKILAVADENTETEEMMVDGLPWNADVVNETSEPLRFENITAKEVIVEGDNAGVVRINGGNIDKVTVKAAEIPEFGFKEIVELIAAGVPVTDVMDMYKENQQLKADSGSIRPTVRVVGGAEIDELVVTGSAVLDMSTGYVDKVTVKPVADSGRVLVTIKNYDGKVEVAQTPNTDGSNNILNVELKNSNLTELNVDGEKKCVFHIGGDNKSDIAVMNVEGSSDVVTMVDTTEVKVAEDVEKASVRIYSDVENLVVDADNSYLYVAASSVVANATVNGDNTTVGFNGRVENSEITGTGSQVVYQAPPTATPSPTPSPKPQGTVIGNENNSTGWWTAHSETVKVEEGETEKVTFYNFTSGSENWHNFLVVLQNVADAHGTADNAAYAEYAVVRADNYGWGAGYDNIAKLESNWNWDTFKSDMNGAKVDLEVTNNGDTADIAANITTEKGKTYFQKYLGIKITGDLYFCLSTEGGHLIIPGTEAPVEPETPVDPENPAEHEHVWVKKETPATCTEAGKTWEECECGEVQKETVLEALGHGELVYKVVTEPTVDKEGKYEETCPVCKEVVKTGTIDKLEATEEILIGAKDFSTVFRAVHSENFKVEAGTAKTVVFKNYNKEDAANWNNFCAVLHNDGGEAYKEYAVLRADNYGWNDAGNTGANLAVLGWKLESNWNWDNFRNILNGATVELTVTNYGDTATLLANVTAANGDTYFQKFGNIAVDGDLYYCLTVDCNYLVIEEVQDAVKVEIPSTPTKVVVGAEDCSTGWWGAHSEAVVVKNGETETVTFKNYNNGGANWNNFVIVLNNQAGNVEYGVMRADNYGWCNSLGLNTGEHYEALGWTVESNWNWDTFVADLNGATVSVSVTNNGTTADVVANVTTAAGATHFQKFLGVAISDGDLSFHMTVDGCYLVFE